MSRWTVGKHESRGDTNDKVALQWFSDPCWKMVYRHDSDGNPTCGSLTSLLEAVNSGHRIRLVYRHSAFEADLLITRDGHVCASVLNDLSKSRVDAFERTIHWVWKHICSTGAIETIRYKKFHLQNSRAGRYSSVGSDVAWESRGTAIDPRVRHIFL